MGLFDIFRSPGALSQEQDTALSQQGMMHPQYQQMMAQATDPRNMEIGQKLQMLGSAMRGNDVSGDIKDYQQGIRDRFQNRYDTARQQRLDQLAAQQTRLNMANTRLGMANTIQTMDHADQKLPGLLRSQDLQNTGQQITNTGGALQNTGQGLSNERTQQLIDQGNAEKIEYVGGPTGGRLISTAPDGKISDVTDQYPQSILQAYQAKSLGGSMSNKNYNPSLGRTLTTAEIKVDETYGKEYAKNNDASSMGNIATLDYVADELSKIDSDTTGLNFNPFGGDLFKSFARVLDPDGSAIFRGLFDQDGLNTQEIVAGVIQKNLRETLGAQFTQKEGQLLIQRAYNPVLSPQYNAARLRAISAYANAVLKEKQKKAAHFRQHGTLAGFVNEGVEERLDAMRKQVVEIYKKNGGYGDETAAPDTGASVSLSPEGKAAYDKYIN